jgi:murein DD-endopeptidase MepM/ murein hydrolase activator NlpD
MAEQGIYPFAISGQLENGAQFSFEQMLILRALGYIQEKIDGVDPATMDPANTKPEDDQVLAIVSQPTPVKMWDGLWAVPGYDPNWITSTFGNRRSYNGGPYSYFHTGVDYGSGTGLPIKAPAPGIVVFAGPLTVRGNATIIDHGWGVFSGFWHQSEFKVKVGDRVETGQEIGLAGATGRITGPHLHWEVWVNGVQVNPLTWLTTSYP